MTWVELEKQLKADGLTVELVKRVRRFLLSPKLDKHMTYAEASAMVQVVGAIGEVLKGEPDYRPEIHEAWTETEELCIS